MNINDFYAIPDEKPLDRLVEGGGFVGIFRSIGCIGDSLSSGELESMTPEGERGYHDYYDISWGQFIARMAGTKVYNFSRGGMTAREYLQSFGEANGFWNPELACQAYIMALGCNDLWGLGLPVGLVDDIDPEDPSKNAPTFAGEFAAVLQKYKQIQPKAKFFLVTMPRTPHHGAQAEEKADAHQKLMYDLAEYFDNTYVIDLREYGPVYDQKFYDHFWIGGHLNAQGYLLTARMVVSYMDYIIRHNPEDFRQVGFIGKGPYYHGLKW